MWNKKHNSSGSVASILILFFSPTLLECNAKSVVESFNTPESLVFAALLWFNSPGCSDVLQAPDVTVAASCV